MKNEEIITITENKTVSITIDNEKIDVDESVYLFKRLMELRNRKIENVNQLINDYLKFIDLWDNFKEMEKQADGESDFEKELDKQILAHTIKPKTEYAHQQEMKNGKPVLYPIYYFRNDGRLESMAPGGNYPIKDCNIFAKSNKGGYVKIN